MSRLTIAVDFDGVIHTYDRGWQDGEIYGELVPGAREALSLLAQRFRLVVFTARYDLDAVRDWLKQKHIDQFFKDVTNKKPAAYAYLDDRAIRFISWDQTLEELNGIQVFN